jgi:hypothetical protein
MTKGFDGPPDAHLPHREPLKANDIDREIIKGMTGFEFGTPEEIEAKLLEILNSDAYAAVVRAYNAKRRGSTSDVASRTVSEKDSPTKTKNANKRFSGLDFYRKKLAGGVAAAFSIKGENDSISDISNGSGSTLLSGLKPESLDPTRGFHPLVSIYYLVREKVEREKIYGPGVFASSTLSLTGPPPLPAPALAHTSQPASPEALVTADYHTATSKLSAEPTYDSSYVPSTTAPVPPPKTRPRTSAFNALGEQPEKASPRRTLGSSRRPATASAAQALSVPGANDLTADDPARVNGIEPPSPVRSEASNNKVLNRRSVSVMSSRPPARPGWERASADIERPRPRTGADELQPPMSATTGTFARRFGSLLGRAASLSEGNRRSPISGPGHRASTKAPLTALPQVTESGSSTSPRQSQPQQQQQQQDADAPLVPARDGKSVERAKTVGEASGRFRHTRGVSLGGGPTASLGRAGGAGVFGGGSMRHASAAPNGSRARPSTAGGVLQEQVEELYTPPSSATQQDIGFVSVHKKRELFGVDSDFAL